MDIGTLAVDAILGKTNTQFCSRDTVLAMFDSLSANYRIEFSNDPDCKDPPVSIWTLTTHGKERKAAYVVIYHHGMLVGFCYLPTGSWTFVKED